MLLLEHIMKTVSSDSVPKTPAGFASSHPPVWDRAAFGGIVFHQSLGSSPSSAIINLKPQDTTDRSMKASPLAFLSLRHWIPFLRSRAVLLLASAIVACAGFARADVVWSEDFEGPTPDWSVDGGTWEFGIPAFGPGAAYSGLRCAGTAMTAGQYSDGASGRLVSPAFLVPSVDQFPRFRWSHWYAFNDGDAGSVQIKVGTNAWVAVPEYPTLYNTSSGVWSDAALDLSAYAGQTVRIGFWFTSQLSGTSSRVAAGWYIDDVRLVTGPYQFNNPEGFESGWGDWSTEGGSWEVGTPTAGPGKAHTGAGCAGTVLGGNYSDGFYQAGADFGRLISPPFVVPSADQFPRFRWSHWYEFNDGDAGSVEIQVGTNAWGAVPEYPTLYNTGSGVWSDAALDLSAYAGQTVRIGFWFTSQLSGTSSRVGAGWYIDDVRLVTGPYQFNNPEGFESGWGDWSTEGGSWEVGTPTAGPGKAHTGAGCAGTVLGGNYSDGFYQAGGNFGRLISPPFVVRLCKDKSFHFGRSCRHYDTAMTTQESIF